jgi:hypothetical protein
MEVISADSPSARATSESGYTQLAGSRRVFEFVRGQALLRRCLNVYYVCTQSARLLWLIANLLNLINVDGAVQRMVVRSATQQGVSITVALCDTATESNPPWQQGACLTCNGGQCLSSCPSSAFIGSQSFAAFASPTTDVECDSTICYAGEPPPSALLCYFLYSPAVGAAYVLACIALAAESLRNLWWLWGLLGATVCYSESLEQELRRIRESPSESERRAAEVEAQSILLWKVLRSTVWYLPFSLVRPGLFVRDVIDGHFYAPFFLEPQLLRSFWVSLTGLLLLDVSQAYSSLLSVLLNDGAWWHVLIAIVSATSAGASLLRIWGAQCIKDLT